LRGRGILRKKSPAAQRGSNLQIILSEKNKKSTPQDQLFSNKFSALHSRGNDRGVIPGGLG
jgi:hypothetical protein